MSAHARRVREREERRNQILTAARKVFSDSGFGSATMDQVAAEAELSKGTLYLYFRSKEELFLAMSSPTIDRLLHEYSDIAAAGGDGITCVKNMLRAWTEQAIADPPLFRSLIVWVSTPGVDVTSEAFAERRRRVDEAIGFLVAAIERGVADRSIRAAAPPKQLAMQIWSGMLGTLAVACSAEELERRFPGLADYGQLADGYIDMICNGLLPTEEE